MSDSTIDYTLVGRITGVFGIKGWLKVASFTDPQENLFEYSPWQIKLRGKCVELKIDQVQRHKNGWIVLFDGVNDRNDAEAYKMLDIAVDRDQFAALGKDDFYWHQLAGLKVKSQQGDQFIDLGTVKELFETGANDVIVVSADESSIDDRERLIPYVFEAYVKSVDLQSRIMIVDWNVDD